MINAFEIQLHTTLSTRNKKNVERICSFIINGGVLGHVMWLYIDDNDDDDEEEDVENEQEGELRISEEEDEEEQIMK